MYDLSGRSWRTRPSPRMQSHEDRPTVRELEGPANSGTFQRPRSYYEILEDLKRRSSQDDLDNRLISLAASGSSRPYIEQPDCRAPKAAHLFGLCHDLAQQSSQGDGQFVRNFDSHVDLTQLYRADIGTMYPGPFGKLFLGQSEFLAGLPNRTGQTSLVRIELPWYSSRPAAPGLQSGTCGAPGACLRRTASQSRPVGRYGMF